MDGSAQRTDVPGTPASPSDASASRELLLGVGLEVFGTTGYVGSTISDICAAASINRRYFYESFATREDLLRAVYDKVVAEVLENTIAAIMATEGMESKARAGVLAFWSTMTGDSRKARVLTIEAVGISAKMEQDRRETRGHLADFIGQQARAIAKESDWGIRLNPELTARNLIAATIDLCVDWLRGNLTFSADELAEHAVRLFSIAAAGVFYDPADPSRNVVHMPDDWHE